MSGGNNCVTPRLVIEGVHVTSDIPGNDGVVIFTQREWNDFLEHVHNGDYDWMNIPVDAPDRAAAIEDANRVAATVPGLQPASV